MIDFRSIETFLDFLKQLVVFRNYGKVRDMEGIVTRSNGHKYEGLITCMQKYLLEYFSEERNHRF